MATSLSTIISRVRNLLGDNSTSEKDIFSYENSAVFTLTEPRVISVTTVLKNSVALATNLWSFDSSTNKVTVTDTLTTGATIEIDYTAYPNYSDTEIKGNIQSAIIYLSINNYYDFQYDSDDDAIYPELEEREKNLVAMITAVLIDKPMTSLRLPDLSIQLPSDLNTQDKISKILSIYKKDGGEVIELL